MFKIRLAIRWPAYIILSGIAALLATVIAVLWTWSMNPVAWVSVSIFLCALATYAHTARGLARLDSSYVIIPTVGSAVASWYLPQLPDICQVSFIPGEGVLIDSTPDDWSLDITDQTTASMFLTALLTTLVTEKAVYGRVTVASYTMLEHAEGVADLLSERHDQHKDVFLEEALARAHAIVKEHLEDILKVSAALKERIQLDSSDLQELLGPRPTVWEKKY